MSIRISKNERLPPRSYQEQRWNHHVSIEKAFSLLIYSFSEKPSFGVVCQRNYCANSSTPRGTGKSDRRKLRPNLHKI